MTATFMKTNPEGRQYLPSRRTVEIVGHELLTPEIVRLTIRDEYIARHAQAAQFVNLYSKNALQLSPRPFGVGEVHGDDVSLMFAVVGRGTAEFRDMKVHDTIDILGPLGKPFDLNESGRYLLIAGGLGIPPIMHAAQKLSERDDVQTTALFGYRNVQFANEYVQQYCNDVRTIDNEHGNVMNLLDEWYRETNCDDDLHDVHILTCGPHPMMKAVANWAYEHNVSAQMSLEERMGCGYGTCVVCITPTIHGNQKVCVDGPVFTREELGWE